MAKLKAPLLSLGASGQIGKSIVFFPWKGLDVAREYVVPANPQTTLQITQRTYFENAVNDIHAAQAQALRPLDEIDKSALALWGSCYPTPRTWFNQAIKGLVDQQVLLALREFVRDGTVTPGVDQLVLDFQLDHNNLAVARFYYGLTKTALISWIAAVKVGSTMTATIAGLTTGLKYYVQLRSVTGGISHPYRSGIYSGVPT